MVLRGKWQDWWYCGSSYGVGKRLRIVWDTMDDIRGEELCSGVIGLLEGMEKNSNTDFDVYSFGFPFHVELKADGRIAYVRGLTVLDVFGEGGE